MSSDEQVRHAGRTLQRRARPLVSDAWAFSGTPRLLVRSKKTPKMTEIGRVAAVLNSIGPEGLSWMILRHGAFEATGNAPTVTDETTWHATEDGLIPHDIHPMPALRLRDIKEEMSLIPTPPSHEH